MRFKVIQRVDGKAPVTRFLSDSIHECFDALDKLGCDVGSAMEYSRLYARDSYYEIFQCDDGVDSKVEYEDLIKARNAWLQARAAPLRKIFHPGNSLSIAKFHRNEEDKLHAHIEGLRVRALEGDALAEGALGSFYERGNGVDRDPKKALECYTKAANQGNVYAQWDLKRYYEEGTIVAKDLKKALYYCALTAMQRKNSYDISSLRKLRSDLAAEFPNAPFVKELQQQDDVVPSVILGCCYEYGVGTSVDQSKAREYYLVAAKQENAYAKSKVTQIQPAVLDTSSSSLQGSSSSASVSTSNVPKHQ